MSGRDLAGIAHGHHAVVVDGDGHALEQVRHGPVHPDDHVSEDRIAGEQHAHGQGKVHRAGQPVTAHAVGMRLRRKAAREAAVIFHEHILAYLDVTLGQNAVHHGSFIHVEQHAAQLDILHHKALLKHLRHQAFQQGVGLILLGKSAKGQGQRHQQRERQGKKAVLLHLHASSFGRHPAVCRALQWNRRIGRPKGSI